MARTRARMLLLAPLLVLSGCSASFYDFNLFSSLDTVHEPDPSRYQGSDGLSNLKVDLASPAVVRALKANYALSTEILLNLQTDPNHPLGGFPPWTSDQQTAAVLYGDLALKCTYGDVLANNAATALLTQAPGNLQSILQSIVPSEVLADSSGTMFSNMITQLFNANIMYQKLGDSVPPVPPGTNMGDVAEKAAVAYLISCVFAAVTVADPGNEIPEMWALVNNQPNNISTLQTVPPNPFGPPMPAPLKNLFDAAGAPYPSA
jgi:hypothetical protein